MEPINVLTWLVAVVALALYAWGFVEEVRGR